MSSPTTLGLVGFGDFARLIAPHLARHVRVTIHDPAPDAQQAARAMGLACADLAGVACCDIVVLAVPLDALEGCLRAIRGHLRAGQMVLDLCSVKQEPARLMQALLPPDVTILATHPLFGPQSARAGIAGHGIVLCPLRGPWRRVAAFLRRDFGLRVLVTTPDDHDRQAAMSQGLTHMLSRALDNLGDLPRIRTRSFDLLIEALAMVRHDSPGVFHAVTEGNPHAAELRQRLIKALGNTGHAVLR